MIIICLLVVYFVYLITRLFIYLLVKKYGEFSYDGLTFAGFKYDHKRNVFVPSKNSWQRKFGYGHIYDVLAPFVSIVIDTEAVHFSYDGFNYLISFWKGQYGITTGAEIGVYRTKDKNVSKETIYNASEEDIIMSFILYKRDEKLIEAHDRNWWLAAFDLGEFSNPKDLKMDVALTFPTSEFLNAFLEGFKSLKYKENEYQVIGNTFMFTFKKPKTKKAFTRNFLVDYFVQKGNKIKVKLYKDCIDEYIEKNGVDDSHAGKYILVSNLVNSVLGDEDEKNR